MPRLHKINFIPPAPVHVLQFSWRLCLQSHSSRSPSASSTFQPLTATSSDGSSNTNVIRTRKPRGAAAHFAERQLPDSSRGFPQAGERVSPLLSASLLPAPYTPPPVSPGRLRLAPCSSGRVRIPHLVYSPTFSCPEKHGRTQRGTHTRSRYPPHPTPSVCPPPRVERLINAWAPTTLPRRGAGVLECWGSLRLQASPGWSLGVCLRHGPPLLMAPAR